MNCFFAVQEQVQTTDKILFLIQNELGAIMD
jgi:hypothetical protein